MPRPDLGHAHPRHRSERRHGLESGEMRRRHIPPLAFAAVLIGSLAAISPIPDGRTSIARAAGATDAAAAIGAATTITTAPAAKPFRIDLADGNDFVAQTNFVQCVGASMQMMLNIMGRSDDHSAPTQLKLQRLARGLSGPTRAGFQRQGASVRGWMSGLNQLAAGPYRLAGADTLADAMRTAAIAIRLTGKPVGLLVWHGRHAWVMSGFKATADPLFDPTFKVTAAYILDPLYPNRSATWGPSPKPGQAVSVTTVGRQFVPRGQGMWPGAIGINPAWSLVGFSGKYVLVLPYRIESVARLWHVAS